MADTPETGKPTSTVRIEKTIKNAPVGDDEMDIISEVATDSRKAARKNRQPAIPVEEEAASGDDAPPDKIATYLQDHTVKIHVDRVSPREYKGKPIAGMIEEYVPPITVEEIETDIRNRFGGGRYRIRILRNGRFVAAQGVSIYGDPKVELDEYDQDPDEDFRAPVPFDPAFSPAGPPVVDNELIELKKQIEKERLKNQLDAVKNDRANHGLAAAHVDPERIRREAEERIRKEMEFRREVDSLRTDTEKKLDSFMNSIKEVLRSQRETDPGRQADIVALDNKIERIKTDVMAEVKGTFSELKALLSSKQQEKPDYTPQLIQAIIEGFSKMSGSGETKLKEIASAESEKTKAMMESMKAIADAQIKVQQAQADKILAVVQSQGGGSIGEISKAVSAVRNMAETLGWAPGGQEEAQPENQSLMERVMAMVEKALPTIMASAAQKSKGGIPGTPGVPGLPAPGGAQDINAIIQQQAQLAAQKIAIPLAQQMAQKQLAEMQARGVIPSPPAHGGRPPGMPGLAMPSQNAPQTQAASTSTVPPQPAQPQAPQPVQVVPTSTGSTPVAITPVVEQKETPVEAAPEPKRVAEDPVLSEKKEIVNSCMELLIREAKLRPRKPEWVDAAFEELPEDILDQLVMVTDVESLVRVIDPYVKPEYLDEMKVILADQRAVDWLVRGLNGLKEMYAEDVAGVDSGEAEDEE